MDKIQKLTPDQTAKMPDYVKKWTAIGLSTKTDREAANKIIDQVYAKGNLPPPQHKIWVKSPLAIIQYVAKQKNFKTMQEARNFISFGYGSHDANWLSFYDFFKTECNIEKCNDLQPLMELAQTCSWFAPFEKVCVLSDNPIECHTIINSRGNNILHKDLGASVLFGDGFACYNLNGIKVTKEIAMTPADNLDPKLIQTETNADVRREILRKIGIKTAVEKLGASILDKNGLYELILINTGTNDRKRPYLKMKDATTDEWYLEGVPPEIKTVKAALAWRESENEKTYQEPLVRT